MRPFFIRHKNIAIAIVINRNRQPIGCRFLLLFAKDLSTENIAIIVEVIAHKQIACESIVVEVI